MSWSDALPIASIGLLTAIALGLLRPRMAGWEFQLVVGSLLTHVVATFVQIWLVFDVYGIGDMIMYRDYGLDLSGVLQRDFFGVLPGLLRVLFHGENTTGVFIPVAGTETGSMVILTGMMLFLTSNSFYAANLAFSVLSFFGKVAMYRGLRIGLPEAPALPLLVSALWIPSCVFWSAGVIKESVTMAGLGLLLLGTVRWMSLGRPALPTMAAGAVGIGLIKPYVLVAFAIAGAVWFYWHRASMRGEVRIRPVALLAASVFGLLALTVLGELFPRYSIGSFVEEAAELQFAATRYRGGSSYLIGDPTERSLLGQLAFTPMAVLTALYRPALFEVRNAQMLVNALETTALLFATVFVMVRHTPAGAWKIVKRRPLLVFCLVFVAVMSVAVGLTSSNLGTLSRYRMPMYPFFAVLLSVLAWTPKKRRSGLDEVRVVVGQAAPERPLFEPLHDRGSGAGGEPAPE